MRLKYTTEFYCHIIQNNCRSSLICVDWSRYEKISLPPSLPPFLPTSLPPSLPPSLLPSSLPPLRCSSSTSPPSPNSLSSLISGWASSTSWTSSYTCRSLTSWWVTMVITVSVTLKNKQGLGIANTLLHTHTHTHTQYEAIPESLKNMLLVMSTQGIFDITATAVQSDSNLTLSKVRCVKHINSSRPVTLPRAQWKPLDVCKLNRPRKFWVATVKLTLSLLWIN